MDIVIKCQHLIVACSLATLVLEGTRGKGNDELYLKGNVVGSLFQFMPISILIRADGVIMNEIGNRAESLLKEAPKRDSLDRTREDQHEDDNYSLWDIMWNGRPSRRLRGRPGQSKSSPCSSSGTGTGFKTTACGAVCPHVGITSPSL